MKAIVYDRFGPPEVLELREVERPTAKDDEVLVKVHAISVNAIDIIYRSGAPRIFGLVRLMTGITKPKLSMLGGDVSGEVEATGEDVKRLKKGDRIYGVAAEGGAYAEYACVPEKTLAIKPANMTYEEAAAVPGTAATALRGLRDIGNVQRGQRVLIYGASGGVGTFAVQLARSFGADVTAVCSTRNVGIAQSLGASRVIDYTEEDFTQSAETYDLIFDAAGKSSFSDCTRSLTPNGMYVTTDFMSPPYTLLQILWTSIVGGKKAKGLMDLRPPSTEDFDFLRGLIETGEVKSVIDRSYPLSQTAEAHRYYEQGHAQGKVVIRVQD